MHAANLKMLAVVLCFAVVVFFLLSMFCYFDSDSHNYAAKWAVRIQTEEAFQCTLHIISLYSSFTCQAIDRYSQVFTRKLFLNNRRIYAIRAAFDSIVTH